MDKHFLWLDDSLKDHADEVFLVRRVLDLNDAGRVSPCPFMGEVLRENLEILMYPNF